MKRITPQVFFDENGFPVTMSLAESVTPEGEKFFELSALATVDGTPDFAIFPFTERGLCQLVILIEKHRAEK